VKSRGQYHYRNSSWQLAFQSQFLSEMLDRYLHLRYKPGRLNFSRCGCGPFPAFNLFDWVFWMPDDEQCCRRKGVFPKTVLCLATKESLAELLRYRWRLKDATVVFAGEDTNLSELLPQIEKLLPKVQKIYFEAKDVVHSAIQSFSMGFISYYVAEAGVAHVRALCGKVKEDEWLKSGVLAAWGGIWAHLDGTLDDRKALCKFVEESDWIERESLSPHDYWERLAESEYMLAPAGQGIQAPKLAEAWLMRTVPIVTANPCFQDLQEEGFPMLILHKWSDLNRQMIEEHASLRIEVDWDRVEKMLTLEHFNERYLQETSERSQDLPN
jgi:hypothetical protein